MELKPDRNKRKIKCSRCHKNIMFSKVDIYEGENDEKFIQCENCGHENKIKKLK